MWKKLKKILWFSGTRKNRRCAKTESLVGIKVQKQKLMKGAQENNTCYFADIWIIPHWFSRLFHKPLQPLYSSFVIH